MVVNLMKIVILVWDYVLVTLVNFCMLLLLLLYDLESDKLCLRVALIIVWYYLLLLLLLILILILLLLIIIIILFHHYP